MTSCSYTLEDLQNLEEAIAKGIKKVKYTDKEIEYRSVDEMLKVRDLIKACLGLDDGRNDGRGLRRVAQHSKGL